MKNILLKLKVLVNPAIWSQNHPYSKRWENVLLSLMARHKFIAHPTIPDKMAQIGGVTVWIGNHPYASFTPYAPVFLLVRPSRAVILMAMEKLIQDIGAVDPLAELEKFASRDTCA